MPPSNVATEALRNALRTATKQAHQGIDHHPLLAPLVRQSVTLSEYRSALAALHGVQAALENALLGFAPADQFPPRLSALSADLALLDQRPSALRVAVPAADTPAQRIGMMYVIEGSNLGGAVIGRQLMLHLPENTPLEFFKQTGGFPRWERYWQFAAQQCGEDDIDPAATAARNTFTFIHAHLDDCLAQGA